MHCKRIVSIFVFFSILPFNTVILFSAVISFYWRWKHQKHTEKKEKNCLNFIWNVQINAITQKWKSTRKHYQMFSCDLFNIFPQIRTNHTWNTTNQKYKKKNNNHHRRNKIFSPSFHNNETVNGNWNRLVDCLVQVMQMWIEKNRAKKQLPADSSSGSREGKNE